LYAQQSAKREAKEETGLLPTSLRHLTTSKAGATVEWDLYYFIVENFTENQDGQELEEGEDITIERKTRDEVKELCLRGEIREERSVGVLLKFLLQA
jgi:8-oxo-dGTP pyrophosphatase MutT (NUDIX family)